MFFADSEMRERHRFADRSIEGAALALQNPQIVQRLGAYASQLSAVAPRLYIPNVRYGRLRIPAKYTDTDMVPVVVAKPRQQIKVSNDFSRFSPRQRRYATEIVRTWRPTKETTEAFASRLEAAARSGHDQSNNLTWIRNDEFAMVCVRSLPAIIKNTHLGAPPPGFRHMLKGRPFVILQYADGTPLPPPTMLHEYEHIDQHERMPIVRCADNAQEVIIHKSNELEAYDVGALTLLGLRDCGELIDDASGQLEIDAICQEVNGPSNFIYNDEIGDRLAAADVSFD